MFNKPAGTFNASYTKDEAVVRTRTQWGLLIILVGILAVVPYYGPLASDYWISFLIYVAITAISVQGLNILTGYCGQISLGQAAFMAIGAYTVAILSTKAGWPFLACLPMAGLMATAVGFIFAIPAVRVKGFYLAITTLAAHFVIMYLIISLEITGGSIGIYIERPRIGSIVFDSPQSFYMLVIGVTIVMTVFAKNIVRTKVGWAFIAIRDNDLAARVMGVNPFTYKLLAFSISAFYAGIAGGLLAYHLQFAHPEHYGLTQAIWLLGILIVGGMGSINGAIFGSIFVRLVDEITNIHISPALGNLFPSLAGQMSAALGLLVFTAIVGIFIIYEPRGLSHRWRLLRASYRLWPFSYWA